MIVSVVRTQHLCGPASLPLDGLATLEVEA